MTRYNLKISIILLILLTACATVEAQQRICTSYVPFSGYSDSLFVDLKNPRMGLYYAKCFFESEYDTFADSNFTVENQNIIQTKKLLIIEPIIEEVTDSIILKKKYSKWGINTAIKPPKGMRILAPIYKDSMATVIIEKESIKWTKVRGSVICLSQDPDNCLMFSCFEMPAKYQTMRYIKQIKPPRKIVANDTITLDSAELAHFGAIKTEYEQITYYHQVLKQMGRVEFPTAKTAKYISPTKKMLRMGETTEWREITCCYRVMDRPDISKVQKALKVRGYYKGKIDGKIGEQTKAALVKFQKDNGLMIGSLDMQTLKVLGARD